MGRFPRLERRSAFLLRDGAKRTREPSGRGAEEIAYPRIWTRLAFSPESKQFAVAKNRTTTVAEFIQCVCATVEPFDRIAATCGAWVFRGQVDPNHVARSFNTTPISSLTGAK